MGEDCKLYCGFECFKCKNKRALLLREKALKSPTPSGGGGPRKITGIKKDEDHQPRRRATLQTIIEVLKVELDMAWDMKMQHPAVDPEKQEDHPGLNEVITKKDEDEKLLRLDKGDNIITDTQAINKKGSHSDPSSRTGEDRKLQRWNEKGKRSAISISDGEDKRPHKGVTQTKAEAAPRVMELLRQRDDAAPALPEDFLARVRSMEGSHPILVLQKQLFKTDIAKVENRLSIPMNQIRRQFLTEEEERRMVEGMEVTIIEPSLEVSHIMLKKWKMKTTCYLYVFTTQWNSLVTRNSLKAGDMVQVWSFRVGSESRFALVKVA